jgi:hypothetical protein
MLSASSAVSMARSFAPLAHDRDRRGAMKHAVHKLCKIHTPLTHILSTPSVHLHASSRIVFRVLTIASVPVGCRCLSYDLVPNGSNVVVTNANKVRFIYLMSDYYLNKQMAKQSQSFQQGMASILNTEWLRMFAAEEFRLLISGSQTINRRDLQAHTQYSSGYTKDHELMRWLWEVIGEFTDDEVASLLRFATSCSRAPLLGFQHLYPQFCIQVRRRHTTRTVEFVRRRDDHRHDNM